MTPETQVALKVLVERAMRPVRATFERKRCMRQELLAHVNEVFDEEVAKTRDEVAAVAATERRFGDARDVAQQLQRTVAIHDRWFSAIERGVTGRPGEGAAHRAFRWAVFAMAHILVTMSFIAVPLGMSKVPPYDWISLLTVCVAMTAGATLLTFHIVLLGSWLRNSLFVTGQRSVMKSGAIMLGSLVLSAGTAFLLFLTLTRNLDWSVGMLNRSLVTAPLFPAMLFMVAWKFEQERPEIDAWATLNVD